MTTEAWVRSERMEIFPMLLLVEFPHNKITPFISNNSFYLLQLKGCHKQHLIAIYVFFIEESIDARLVWQNIGKKMSSYGAALTIA